MSSDNKMTELLDPTDAPSDAELISRVRGGDLEAYGDLFARHVESARRLARQLTRGGDTDDLVSDAFAKVMGVLQAGGGPDVAFRAYLLTAVRRLHVDRIRVTSRLTTAGDMEPFDPGVPFQDTAVEQFESGAAAKAFASLPERWQLVLWHLEVENQKPADIAPLLGMSANSVSALAYRAREGLRQAFLSAHLAETTDADCRWVTEHLGSYVRNGLAKRDNARIDSHLERCRGCTAMYLELTEVNSNLRGLIAPLLLGSLATGYAAGAGAGAGTGGVLVLLGRAKDFALSNLTPIAAGTTAAGIAVATIVALNVGGGDIGGGDSPVAARSPSVSSPAAGRPTAEVPSTADQGTRQRREQLPPTLRRVAASPTGLPTTAPEPVSAAAAAAGQPATDPAAGPAAGPTADPAAGPADGRPGDGQPSSDPDGNPSPSDPPGPTGAPPAPRTADTRVGSVGITDDNEIVVAVDGLPDERVSILVDLSSRSGETTFATTNGPCQVTPGNRTRARCTSAGRELRATLPLAFPDDLRSDRLRVDVELVGYRESDPSDNSGSVDFEPNRPEPPPEGRDIVLELRSSGVGRPFGRFQAAVHRLDPRRSPTTLHFRVSFSDRRVDFERIPQNCRYSDGDRTLIVCTARGARFHASFDADLRPLPEGESVTVTLTVSIPGVSDPRPAGNTRSITLQRSDEPPGSGPR